MLATECLKLWNPADLEARNTEAVEGGVEHIASQDIRVQWRSIRPAKDKILGSDVQRLLPVAHKVRANASPR
jgi:hypothetical protein